MVYDPSYICVYHGHLNLKLLVDKIFLLLLALWALWVACASCASKMKDPIFID